MNCLELAQKNLEQKAIRPNTYRGYMSVLRSLDLCDVPSEQLSVAFLTNRMLRTINPNTRRRQAIALRSMFGIPVKCPAVVVKEYDLPDVELIREALEPSRYRLYGLLMLYCGFRLGETLVKQRMPKPNVVYVDRQRLIDGSIGPAKTIGPVVMPTWLAEEYRDTPADQFDRAHITVFKGIKRAGNKKKLDINPQLLRHSFGTMLANKGAHPEVLRKQMRHSSVNTSLKFYVTTRQADIEGVVDLL